MTVNHPVSHKLDRLREAGFCVLRVPHPERFLRRVGIFLRLSTRESVASGHGFSRAVNRRS